MRFANSYFDKRQTQRITFHRKGTARTPALPLDCTAYREIDTTSVSAEWLSIVDSIRSRQELQVGASTHLLPEVTLCLPRFALPKKGSTRRGIATHIWKDPEYWGQIMALLMDALQQAIHHQPVHIHIYEALAGSGGPPSLDTASDPHLEIYIDGSADGTSDDRVAGWAFLIEANVPFHFRQPIEVVDGNNYIVFKRYGGVVTRNDSDRYIGAIRKTNNTGEISALIEAVLYVLFETTLASDFPMSFIFDSL